jgi:hypothetical protein
MSDNYDNSYLDDKNDDLIWEHQTIDEFNAITEFSRQLRSFLKYKEQVIRYRFRSMVTPSVNHDTFKFTKDKKELHEAVANFIHILKEIKKDADSLEQGIQYHAITPNSSLIHQLIEVTETLIILIHKFSEQEIHDHPHLLKLLVSMARETCTLKKHLNLDIEEFLSELELDYEELEEELDEMLSQRDNQESKPVKKQLEEKLRL